MVVFSLQRSLLQMMHMAVIIPLDASSRSVDYILQEVSLLSELYASASNCSSHTAYHRLGLIFNLHLIHIQVIEAFLNKKKADYHVTL